MDSPAPERPAAPESVDHHFPSWVPARDFSASLFAVVAPSSSRDARPPRRTADMAQIEKGVARDVLSL